MRSEYLFQKLEEGKGLKAQGYRGRYAPTTSGPLHFGNIRTALISWLQARLNKGTWLLRVDDLDTARNKQGALESIEYDLTWLGLKWDGPTLLQSKRRGLYRLAISHLRNQNKIYPCVCSRKSLAIATSNQKNKIYPGRCRNLNLSYGFHQEQLPSLRLKVNKVYENKCGDVIIRRSDGYIAYHLASVIDELTLGINEVVRGVDLLDALYPQLAIIDSLQQDQLIYQHAPILLDKKGNKLSKRNNINGLEVFRSNGMRPPKVIGLMASSLGLVPSGTELSALELLTELKLLNNQKGLNVLSNVFLKSYS